MVITLTSIVLFIQNLCKIFLIAYFITRFEPVQSILNEFGDWVYATKKNSKNFFVKITELITLILVSALTCSKCLSFWLGVFLFRDFYLAASASLLMTIFERTIGNWLERVNLN